VPEEVLFQRVADVVSRMFGIDAPELAPESGVGSIQGWDSMGHLRLMMEVEQTFQVRFDTADLGAPQNIRALCELLSRYLDS